MSCKARKREIRKAKALHGKKWYAHISLSRVERARARRREAPSFGLGLLALAASIKNGEKR